MSQRPLSSFFSPKSPAQNTTPSSTDVKKISSYFSKPGASETTKPSPSNLPASSSSSSSSSASTSTKKTSAPISIDLGSEEPPKKKPRTEEEPLKPQLTSPKTSKLSAASQKAVDELLSMITPEDLMDDEEVVLPTSIAAPPPPIQQKSNIVDSNQGSSSSARKPTPVRAAEPEKKSSVVSSFFAPKSPASSSSNAKPAVQSETPKEKPKTENKKRKADDMEDKGEAPVTKKKVKLENPKTPVRKGRKANDDDDDDDDDDDGDEKAYKDDENDDNDGEGFGNTEKLRDERERKQKQKDEMRQQQRQMKFQFLEKPLDENKNPVGHPDYDPRTIYVPQSSWLLFTPFEKQFWEIKRKCFDTVLFFRKGKFFELFETDADIGHRVLGLRVTDRASMKMCGFPDKDYKRWAAKLIQTGYKVAKADQVENKHSFAARREALGDNKPEKNSADQLMKRELSHILTPGTLVDDDLLGSSRATYLLALLVRLRSSF